MECSGTNPLSNGYSSSSLYSNNNNNNNFYHSTQLVQSILSDSRSNKINQNHRHTMSLLDYPFPSHSRKFIQRISQLGYVALRVRSGKVVRELYVKENVLKAASPYFNDLLELRHLTQGVGNKEIEIFDRNFKALAHALNFMVFGDRFMTCDHYAVDILRIADHYAIEEIKNKCDDWLARNITIKNYQELWDIMEYFNLPTLKNELWHFVIEEFLYDYDRSLQDKDLLSKFVKQHGYCLQKLNSAKAKMTGDISLFLPLLPLFPNITTLELSYPSNQYGAIVGSCPNLVTLKIGAYDNFKDDNFQAIMENCSSNLENLDLSGSGIDDNSLAFIGDRFPNLQFLNISWCRWVTHNGLQTIFKKCQKLKSLRMFD